MRRYRFHLVDVFAEAPLEGHLLGVFPVARRLTGGRLAGRVEPVVTGTITLPG